MMHELAHAWFGNSVTPWEWSDIWMSEGHVSWYEFVFAEERGQLEVDTEFWPDEQGYATVVELMRAIYAHGDEWRRTSARSRGRTPASSTTCSASRPTTAARSSSTRCGRRSARRRSRRSSARGSSATATAR